MSHDTTREVMAFMQIDASLDGDSGSDIAAFARSKNWPLPEKGKVFASAMDPAGHELGRIEIDLKDPAGPKGVAAFIRQHLRRLVLDRAQIRGEDLVLLQRLPELRELRIESPSLEFLLIEPGGFPKLEHLSVATSGLTDDAVAHLARLVGLKDLDLSGTKMTAAGIDRLRKSLPNCRIAYAPGRP
jgi:hypothetical protein